MATGIPKNQWNDNSISDNQSNITEISSEISLVYEGKEPEEKILDLPSANCILMGKVGEEINQLYYGDNLPILLSFLQNKNIQKIS